MTSFATILEEGIIEINSEAVEDDTNIIDATSVRDVNTNKTEVRFDSQVAGASKVLSHHPSNRSPALTSRRLQINDVMHRFGSMAVIAEYKSKRLVIVKCLHLPQH